MWLREDGTKYEGEGTPSAFLHAHPQNYALPSQADAPLLLCKAADGTQKGGISTDPGLLGGA